MKFWLCLLFMLTVTFAYADIRESEEAIYLSAPNTPWELRFPKRGWALQKEHQKQDGLAYYYMFSSPKTLMHASFYIEPAEKCKTSKDCRSMFWSNPGPLYENPQSVEQFEENGFAVVKFIIPSFRGMQVNQLNYSAHIVRDGYWVDAHLSKLPSQKGDEALLSAFLRTISFEQKPTTATKAGRKVRRYSLPDHGFFHIEVLSSWKDELRQPPDRLPPTIVLKPASGNAFTMQMTPIWPSKKEMAPPTTQKIRELVQESAEKARPQSMEQVINLVELKGTSGMGYYFAVTDRAPKPGEYKFMIQGILTVGELMVTFTILTNDSRGEIARETLTLIREANHLK